MTDFEAGRCGARVAPCVSRVIGCLGVFAVLLSSSAPAMQVAAGFAGVWVVDRERSDARDIYGELRVIDERDEEVRLTIVDYGSAWIAGAFRDAVHVLSWRFRFDRWGPRRGPSDSKQPRTIARASGAQLVLAKSTFSGNGNFVWVWSLDAAGRELFQQESGRSWDSDFITRPPQGLRTRFVRTAPQDPSLALLRRRVEGSASVVSEPSMIVVRPNADASALLVECPEHDCTIVRLESGRRAGSRPLPRGVVGTLPLDAEAMIQPVP